MTAPAVGRIAEVGDVPGIAPRGVGAIDHAFTDAYAELRAECVRIAWHLTSDQADAEDIAADVLAAAWQRHRAGGVEELRRYVRRAVVNRSRSWLRRRYVRARRALSGDERGVRWHADDVADRDTVWGALRRLPMRQRAAVVLRYYEDLSVAEAAEVLGVSEGTIKSNTSRGLARLERLLSAGGEGR